MVRRTQKGRVWMEALVNFILDYKSIFCCQSAVCLTEFV